MISKIVLLFLIGMAILAMFGRLRFPGQNKIKSLRCEKCGQFKIGKITCKSSECPYLWLRNRHVERTLNSSLPYIRRCIDFTVVLASSSIGSEVEKCENEQKGQNAIEGCFGPSYEVWICFLGLYQSRHSLFHFDRLGFFLEHFHFALARRNG